MKRIIIALSFAATLVITGLVLLFVIRGNQTGIVTPAATSAQISAARASAPVVKAPVQGGEPIAVSVPSLSIDLSVVPGVYNEKTQQWTLTADKAQYAVVTPRPNDTAGNTFIYGHYRKGVFATLHNIQPGAEAIVKTDDGKTFTYKLTGVRVVSPEESDAVFGYQGAPILTLQTCTGLFFQDRQLFTFSLEKVS